MIKCKNIGIITKKKILFHVLTFYVQHKSSCARYAHGYNWPNNFFWPQINIINLHGSSYALLVGSGISNWKIVFFFAILNKWGKVPDLTEISYKSVIYLRSTFAITSRNWSVLLNQFIQKHIVNYI